MINKALTLSIVIPVYNEENYIKACLDSIEHQSERPNEVIVVDNNSTDKTAQIASSYGFVTLLHEKRQHQSFAQIKGFNNSRGDIIARIDADTILAQDWVKNIKKHFVSCKESVAVTGPADFYDVCLRKFAQSFFHIYHFFLASKLANHGMMWGTNCAFRSSVWGKVKKNLTTQCDIWEDYDLSFGLAKHGRIDYCNNIKVGCSLRSAHKDVSQLIEYQIRGVKTFKLHVSKKRLVLFTLLWSSMLAFIPLAIADHIIVRYMGFIRSPRFTLPYYIARQAREDYLIS
jgi:glycosyltransferase involved in cell wall biosynthesis